MDTKLIQKSKTDIQKGYLLPAAFLVASILSCNEGAKNKAEKVRTMTPIQGPAVMQYHIVKEYPHDPKAFTEGLQYADGVLYESTGEYGISELRKVELNTGKVLASTKMENKYFGEGLSVLNGKVYQLTYREHTGFIYDAKTLKQTGTFSYSSDEGWGMATDGKYLVYDDGSNLLHYLEPGTFKEVKTLHVTDENGAVDEINEPEFINGYIYANKWKTPYILKIDTATGRVVGRADLSQLAESIVDGSQPQDGSRGPDVLNGIAYDATGGRIFVTGKNWPKLFEIKFN